MCKTKKKKWEYEVKTGFLKMEKYSMCVVVKMISGEMKMKMKEKDVGNAEEDP